MTAKPVLAPVQDLKPRLTVIGVGGAGCNAINNMILSGLTDVDFVAANTDAQSLAASSAEFRVQLGAKLTEGLGAGSKPEIGEAAAEEAIEEIRKVVAGSHMVFVAAGMGGGTGTGAASVIARIAREMGILTVGVVTRPFTFEGQRRQRLADIGITKLRDNVDTLIVIPNQNLFRIANEKTTFAEAFLLADQVLHSGVACIVDLIVKDGLINLDFADVRTIMTGMGTAMMGTGEASGADRARMAAEEAISNPLLEDVTLQGAKGLLLAITGGHSLTLFEVDQAASRVKQEVDPDAVIIVGATFDEALGDKVRVSIVASGMAKQVRDDSVMSAMPMTASPQRNAAPIHQIQELPTTPPPLPTNFQQALAPAHDLQTRLSNALEMATQLSGNPGRGYQDQPPPLPSAPGSWMAPGNVRIEEQASLQPAPFAFGGYPAHQPMPPPAFTPQPPVDIRGAGRRIPDVSDFSPIGQREYHAKKAAWPVQEPPRVLSEPRSASTADRKQGWFGRFAGRISGASDSHVSGAGTQNTEQGSSGVGHPHQDGRSERQAGQPSRQEVADLPAFFRGARR
jgi:cell division protein FtsZ